MTVGTLKWGRKLKASLLDPKSEESQAKEKLSAAVERAFRMGKEHQISEANFGALL
jgi:hypothetical protein